MQLMRKFWSLTSSKSLILVVLCLFSVFMIFAFNVPAASAAEHVEITYGSEYQDWDTNAPGVVKNEILIRTYLFGPNNWVDGETYEVEVVFETERWWNFDHWELYWESLYYINLNITRIYINHTGSGGPDYIKNCNLQLNWSMLDAVGTKLNVTYNEGEGLNLKAYVDVVMYNPSNYARTRLYVCEGNAELYVPPNFTVTAPSSSDNFITGSTHSVLWSSVGDASRVNIDLYNGSGFLARVESNGVNDGTFSWTVQSSLSTGTGYYINVSAFSDSSRWNISEPFNITRKKTLTVTSPNTMVHWQRETRQNVTWTWTGEMPIVDIKLYNTSQQYITDIILNTPNDGKYEWDVPLSIPITLYYLKIFYSSDPRVNDTSNMAFYIDLEDTITVTSPTANSSWGAGRSYEISWTTTGTISNVKIDLYKGGAFLKEALTSTTNDGAESWILPENLVPGNDYQFNVSSLEDPSDFDLSDPFNVTGKATITILTPNSSSVFRNMVTNMIRWQSTGIVEYVQIDVYKNGTYFTYASYYNVENTGSFGWWPDTYEMPSGGLYQIRIFDPDYPNVSAFSDEFLFVYNDHQISVTHPPWVQGQHLAQGSAEYISCSWSGAIQYVNIELWTSDYEYHSTIYTRVETGWSDWTIPYSVPAGQYRIKMYETYDPEIVGFSSWFYIDAAKPNSLTILAPPNGGTVYSGRNYNVTWTSTGAVQRVNLELYNGSTLVANYSSRMNNGLFSWGINNSFALGSNYYFKLVSTTNQSLYDLSGPFEIQEFKEQGGPPADPTLWIILAIVLIGVGAVIASTMYYRTRRKVLPPTLGLGKSSWVNKALGYSLELERKVLSLSEKPTDVTKISDPELLALFGKPFALLPSDIITRLDQSGLQDDEKIEILRNAVLLPIEENEELLNELLSNKDGE
ncbi:MAG: GPI anchored serine-threonine rich family protein [Candidatus Helarchaeota archaeon]|nr:GPI anchored serine-threonine rich family protein [Candidatus Helarchaeota archaeon]